MSEIERLLDEARRLSPADRRRVLQRLSEIDRQDAGQREIGELARQINGYWYRTLDEVPPYQPDYLPTGAVLPEGSGLGPEATCLDLVQLDDGWFPLSVSGMYTYSHSSDLKYGRECYFRPQSDETVYRVALAGEIGRDEVTRRFGPAAGDRARSDRNTILLRLIPV